MADTGGLAVLLKALNDSPGLGAGLKQSGVANSSAVARAQKLAKTAGVSKSADIAKTGISNLRALQAATTVFSAAPANLPKILLPEGKGLDPKAPRGSYVNLVV